MEKRIKVVIADDQELMLRGLEALLDKSRFAVVGTATDGAQLLKVVAATEPDVVLTDIRMPEMNGIEACRAIRRQYPLTEVVALTNHDEDQFVLDIVQAGAKGFLFKDKSLEEVHRALQTVSAGNCYACATTSQRLMQLLRDTGAEGFGPVKKNPFSETEVQVIRLLCEEYGSKGIAMELKLTENTVNKYRQRILEKTGAQTVAGIVRYAIRSGLWQEKGPRWRGVSGEG